MIFALYAGAPHVLLFRFDLDFRSKLCGIL